MPQNIFKIYDGRTNFWQWDTKQKLIVLDEHITEVRFSHKDMEHSEYRIVYTDESGMRVCNVPDLLLQIPKNLIAYACIKDKDGASSTVKSVKFAVYKQPIPSNYTYEQNESMDNVLARIALLEELIKDVEVGAQQLLKFDNADEATRCAISNGTSGDIIIVKINEEWTPCVVEEDTRLSPICNCEGEKITIDILDGGDGDGYDGNETVRFWDGGGAASI